MENFFEAHVWAQQLLWLLPMLVGVVLIIIAINIPIIIFLFFFNFSIFLSSYLSAFNLNKLFVMTTLYPAIRAIPQNIVIPKLLIGTKLIKQNVITVIQIGTIFIKNSLYVSLFAICTPVLVNSLFFPFSFDKNLLTKI